MKVSKGICFTILFFYSLLAQPNQNFNLDPYNPTYEPNVILVKFKDDASISKGLAKGVATTGISSIDQLNQTYKVESMGQIFPNIQSRLSKPTFRDPSGKVHEVPNLDKIYKLKYKADIDPKELIEQYKADLNVEYAEPDYHVFAMATYPDDPFYQSGDQWYIDAVNAPAAWDSTTGDTTQIIGIIDTGVDWDHPDLDDNIRINWAEYNGIAGVDDDENGFIDDIRGWDFVNNDNNPNDDNSHGTHVAGIAAAESNNGIGITGIAWNAKILPVKMLQSSGQGSSSDLAASIDYAANNGATVINMSLGSYGESQTVKIVLENAYAYAVLVAAAGNNGYKVDPPYPPWPPYAPMYPACYGFVIGVEATTSSGGLAGFSNFDPSGPAVAGNPYGHNYEIKAPGVGIYSTFPNGNYNSLSGTSMASPIVAGAVALMKSYNPNQSTEQVFARLIQGANNGVLDIRNSLDYELVPDLHYLEYTLLDTLPGCDNDGIADAGETIEIYLTVKNAGGFADSVWSKLRFGEFEDNTVANIIDSTSYIGDISAYATLTGELDPFRIEIDSDVANNRDIVFEYEIGAANHSSFTGELIITVQKGIEFSGLYENLVHLTTDKYYIITGNVVFDSLIIDPGTIIRLNEDAGLLISSHLDVTGTPDSMITFTNNGERNWEQIKNVSNNPMVMKYCIIEYSTGDYYGSIKEIDLNNCILRYNSSSFTTSQFTNIQQCLFVNNNSANSLIDSHRGGLIEKNIFVNNETSQPAVTIWQAFMSINALRNNIFINNIQPTFNSAYSFSTAFPVWSINKLSPNYWGAIDSTNIESMILDFFEDSDYPVLIGSDSALVAPSAECHGIVWKVEINNQNPQEVQIDPIGMETVKFDIYFNRAMDTTYTPFLTFGVREPYTQHVVHENASWSVDSAIWTAYYMAGLETGDGINTIRVANAKDTDHFEIPIEDSRFQFVIQAAGAASIKFVATPGIGKVDLEWPAAESPDVLGYNIYRFESLTDSTFSDTLMINSSLVIDTTFTDFSVIPDSTYRYLYSVVGTDMQESDYSKSISAKPFSAANGDANGDMSVNVLDIISIVNYMLQNNPHPFLFDAADINGDDAINVLDIISVVSIILDGDKTAKLAGIDATEAIFSVSKNKLQVSSNGSIGGYQFMAIGNIDDLRITSLFPMEVATMKISDNSKLVVVYSLKREFIPKGNQDVLTFTETEDIDITDLVVSDRFGEQVAAKIGTPGETLLPEKFSLGQNYPNPFNNSTMIEYNVPEISNIAIRIYNLMGQIVSTYEVKNQAPGYYHYLWNGRNMSGQMVSSGVYFYQLKADRFIDTRKMVLLK